MMEVAFGRLSRKFLIVGVFILFMFFLPIVFAGSVGCTDGAICIRGGLDVQYGNLSVNVSDFFVDANNSKVGIGTITPQNRLNVLGDGNFTGTVYALGVNLSANNDSMRNYVNLQNASVVNWVSNIFNTTRNNYVAFVNTSMKNYVDATFLLNTGDTATGNYTFDTNTFFIDSTNNRIGIGTISPSSKLNVNGSSDGGITIQRTGGGASEPFIILKGESSGSGGQIRGLLGGGLRFTNITSAAEYMRITGSGKVGIGEDNPLADVAIGGQGLSDYKVFINGDKNYGIYSMGIDYAGYFYSSGTGIYAQGSPAIYSVGAVKLTNLGSVIDDRTVCAIASSGELELKSGTCGTSSRLYKKNIENLSLATPLLVQLNPVSFEYLNYSERGIDSNISINEGRTERRIGLIAEDVNNIIPEVVEYNSTGSPDGIDYPNLVPLLIKGFQEQQAQIQEQQNQINQMKATLCKLGEQEYC